MGVYCPLIYKRVNNKSISLQLFNNDKLLTDIFLYLQVWFKNRRAKWRKHKREEQERLRKLQDNNINNTNSNMTTTLKKQMDDNESSLKATNYYSDVSSDLEVE